MNLQRRISSLAVGAMLIAASFGLSGCGSTAASSASSLTLAGTLALSGGSLVTTSSYLQQNATMMMDLTPAAVTATDLHILCLTLSIPPSSGEGDVNSDGTFSFSIPGGKGKKLGCFIVNKVDPTTVYGTMVFKDTTKTDLSGSASTTESATFAGSVDLGSFTFDLDSGEAVIDVADITSTEGTDVLDDTVVASGSAFDVTGEHLIAAVTTAEKAAFDPLNTMAGPCTSKADGCDGPPEGQIIYLNRVAGTDADGNAAYGMVGWNSKAEYVACGSTIGTTVAKIKTDTGIDFAAAETAGQSFADFTYSSTVLLEGQTIPLTDGWKAACSNQSKCAKAKHPVQAGGPVTVTFTSGTYSGKVLNGWSQLDSSNRRNVSLNGGCIITSTGKPIQINDWQNVSPGSCDSESTVGSATISTGGAAMTFKRNVCHNTYNSTAITCSNEYASDASFDWGAITTYYNLGTYCASPLGSAGNARDLAQLRCYAEYYDQEIRRNATGCTQNIRTNYNATTPADFISSGNDKPDSNFFANLLTYAPDGSSASLREEHEDYRGVPVADSNGSSYVNCRVKSVGTITITPTATAGRSIATYAEQSINKDTSNTACEAAFGNSGSASKIKKFLFSITKQ
jgi:hypothetical protein